MSCQLLGIVEQALLIAEPLEEFLVSRRLLAPAVELYLLLAAEAPAQVSRYPAGYLKMWCHVLHVLLLFL